MLYENRDPFRMREPAGTLDASQATYTAIGERQVRVEGSRFARAAQYTVKLEGAAPAGYQTLIIVGIRDPRVLARLEEFRAGVLAYLRAGAAKTFGLADDEFDLRLVAYGYDALGPAHPASPAAEVGLVFTATAADQATATQLAKFANPVLLHAPLAGATALPSYALLGSPAEIERGQVHEFVLCHAVDVETPAELFRTLHSEATV
jgi:hypothetical protein